MAFTAHLGRDVHCRKARLRIEKERKGKKKEEKERKRKKKKEKIDLGVGGARPLHPHHYRSFPFLCPIYVLPCLGFPRDSCGIPYARQSSGLASAVSVVSVGSVVSVASAVSVGRVVRGVW